MSQKKSNPEIKAILLGNVGVGKTNLINVSVGLPFNKNEKSTISNTFVTKVLKIDNQNYNIDLWDTAGQEKYYNITKIFFKGSQLVIFVYDITSKASFDGLSKWIEMAEQIVDGNYTCGIVGNKNDLYLKTEVDEKTAREFAKSKNYKFKLVSALNDPKGFQEFLEELAKEYINKGGEGKKGMKLGDTEEGQDKKGCCGGKKN